VGALAWWGRVRLLLLLTLLRVGWRRAAASASALLLRAQVGRWGLRVICCCWYWVGLCSDSVRGFARCKVRCNSSGSSTVLRHVSSADRRWVHGVLKAAEGGSSSSSGT
jgi:hypothetical protein